MTPLETVTRFKFVTRDLTARENLLHAGWAKSESGLLDTLEVDGSRIIIRRRDGAVDELQKGAFRCTSYQTSSAGRLFIVKTDDGRKIRFMEMPGMLPDDQWDVIAGNVLGAVPSNIVNAMLQGGFAILAGMLAAAITVGVLAGMLDLTHEQIAFQSPLSLGLMVAWAVALWFAYGRVRRML